MRPACLAIFFLELELGEVFALGDAWNLPSEGKGVGLFPAGQSSRRGQCTGTDPFKLAARCTLMDRHVCATHRPYHNHHKHHTP